MYSEHQEEDPSLLTHPSCSLPPATDSSDRFKTLKTVSILPYIWPHLNPPRLLPAKFSSFAVPAQILPSASMLSIIGLISSSFLLSAFSSSHFIKPLSLFFKYYTQKLHLFSYLMFFPPFFSPLFAHVIVLFLHDLLASAIVLSLFLSLPNFSLSCLGFAPSLPPCLSHCPHLCLHFPYYLHSPSSSSSPSFLV